jgi:1-aminocyclopropane-1-carboxylate deaminase/D-cysteine desulfhydrase-like pyridoxal-dependent ACC family enzyme
VAVNELQRVRLGSFPTPCEPAPELGSLLGINELWVKRDDLTGYSWGGNKIRTIEFLLADAIRQGSDTVIVCGGPTSNFAALMAVACTQHGLAVHQVSYGSRPSRAPAALAVSLQSGAVIEFTGSLDRAKMDTAAHASACRLRAEGKHPYVVPRGGATAVGALGFANAAVELSGQLERLGVDAVTVVLPVGSGGTIAGLVAGWKYALGASNGARSFDIEIVGVCVSRPPDELRGAIDSMAVDCGAYASRGIRRPSTDNCRWSLVDGRGAGFGLSDGREDAMIDEIARRTRFLVDTTYNGKALVWLRDSSSRLSGPIIYWHTGGTLGVIDRISDRHAAAATPSKKKE